MEYHVLIVDGEVLGNRSEEDTDYQVSFPDIENGWQEEDAEQEPLDWCNSAAIRLDESDDAIHLCISTGDPRGAFVMTVRRLPSGQLLMHVPTPEQGMLHQPLTPLHTGTYQIGYFVESGQEG